MEPIRSYLRSSLGRSDPKPGGFIGEIKDWKIVLKDISNESKEWRHLITVAAVETSKLLKICGKYMKFGLAVVPLFGFRMFWKYLVGGGGGAVELGAGGEVELGAGGADELGAGGADDVDGAGGADDVDGAGGADVEGQSEYLLLGPSNRRGSIFKVMSSNAFEAIKVNEVANTCERVIGLRAAPHNVLRIREKASLLDLKTSWNNPLKNGLNEMAFYDILKKNVVPPVEVKKGGLGRIFDAYYR